MGLITITNLNDGINVKSDPTAISDSGLQDCVGFDLTTEGIIRTAGGLAVSDIEDKLPTGNIQCVEKAFIQSTEYVLATTTDGLYANGILVQAGFTGRFKHVNFGSNIYLVNGTLAIRFDGTTCYKWGITAPTSVPTITPGTYLSNPIDDFEDATPWTAAQVDCVITDEAVIVKDGTNSMKITVAASAVGYSHVAFTTDLTKFSDGTDSSDKDYIRFWLYVDELENLESLALQFDIGDGSFLNDFLNFTLASTETGGGLQALGYGTSANIIAEDSIVAGDGNVNDEEVYWQYSDLRYKLTAKKTISVTKNAGDTPVTPELGDQILTYQTPSSLYGIQSGVWLDVKIPKNKFSQNGDISKGWDNITNVRLVVRATSKGAVNVYLDTMELVGGSDLVGEYYFGYSYARRDSSNNILHESGAARASRKILFSGPVKFDREPLVYAARPLSSDAQVNAGLLFGIGGSLSDFWILAQINDNTTVTDTLTDVGEDKAERIIYSRNSEPAPAGTDLVVHQNKIWMVGDDNYPRLLRSSDILGDGTFAPEAWPTRNAYDLEGNNGALININLVNQIPVIKGDSGEWVIQVLDATDSLQVGGKRVSALGLIGQDAVVAFETSNIYPSHGGFVESNAGQAQFILPEIQPLIDDGMVSAKGVNAGLVSYFTYSSTLSGPRTAKIDLLKGKPRFSNLNAYLLDWLAVDVKTNRVYAVKNGGVYLLDSGYVDASTLGGELSALLKSKAYQPGSLVAWNRMELIHNTGGVWYILDVYIDGVLKSSSPFKSSARTVTNFRDFGPVSGYSFQFRITGNYTQAGEIYLPIRIYYGGK
jgi:hypothetical protein